MKTCGDEAFRKFAKGKPGPAQHVCEDFKDGKVPEGKDDKWCTVNGPKNWPPEVKKVLDEFKAQKK